MSSDQNFNPYYRWLGIPEDIEHPDYYQLLGITQFEESVEVISNAADTRMRILRTFQTGKYSEISQRVLNEVSAARVCLLNADKKAEYDNELRIEVLTKLEKVFLAQESEVQTSEKIPDEKIPEEKAPEVADEELSIDDDAELSIDDDDELSIDDDAQRVFEVNAKKAKTPPPAPSAQQRSQAAKATPSRPVPVKSVPIPVKASSRKTPPAPPKKEFPSFASSEKSSSSPVRRGYTSRKKSNNSVVIGIVVTVVALAVLAFVLATCL